MIIHVIEIQKNMTHIIRLNLNTSFTSNRFSKSLSGNVNRRPVCESLSIIVHLQVEQAGHFLEWWRPPLVYHLVGHILLELIELDFVILSCQCIDGSISIRKGYWVFRNGVEKLQNRAWGPLYYLFIIWDFWDLSIVRVQWRGRRPTELWDWKREKLALGEMWIRLHLAIWGIMLQRWVTEGWEVHLEEPGSQPKSQR